MDSEPKRLAVNQRTLLETMPEMALLVTGDGAVEYMNPSAAGFFAEAGESSEFPEFKKVILEILKRTSNETNGRTDNTVELRDRSYACHFGPFSGYRGDSLHWLVLRRLSPPRSAGAKDEPRPSDKPSMIGTSPLMRNLYKKVTKVAQTDVGVLITGESGTGKEMVANLIHRHSKRRDKPFLSINCSSLNEMLLESDLFGYEKGAFTGAYSRKKGKFEAVDGGTLFLDEIGDISPRLQATLLRVLQNGEIVRVGGTAAVRVDVRIIAATNIDLVKAVQNDHFRLDLFYRLNVVNITTPPLRRRKGDIIELAEYFFYKYCQEFDRNMCFKPELIHDHLIGYEWPGNVRELENVIQRAILNSESDTISSEHIHFDMPQAEPVAEPSLSDTIKLFNGKPLKGIIEEIEKELIRTKLHKTRGNVALTAENLSISKASLYEKMKRYDISAKATRQ